MNHYLAFDLGAESGRLMLAELNHRTLHLRELHRFPNTPIRTASNELHWDISALFDNILAGLRKAEPLDHPVSSVSTDSWGVDYVLFDEAGRKIDPAFHYRDPRTARGVENALQKIDRETLYAESGIQFMPINTSFQLAAESPQRLRQAALLLGISDAFNFLLSGVAVAEESMASTTQLYHPKKRRWSQRLLESLELPPSLFPRVVPAGTELGPLLQPQPLPAALRHTRVVATCSHDTGAAVAGIPAHGDDWAYLSSGTWSLMGAELPSPLLTDQARDLNFTNEIGYRGSIRLLKNIIGLWLLQECRRCWQHQGLAQDYATLTEMARQAPPFLSLINPADLRFLNPPDMPNAIAAFCRETGQPVPETPAAFTRCILESLAFLYRHTFLQLQDLLGKPLRKLHIVGGGSQNHLLNQFTADALQLPVLAGPVEATALGNVIVQAITMGHIPSWQHGRELISLSFPLSRFDPIQPDTWDQQQSRFAQLLQH